MFSSSLYETPEQHAENPPSTWRVEKQRQPYGGTGIRWAVVDKQDRTIGQQHRTRRDATADMTDGDLAWRWENDRKWYAGEPTPGRKPYAEVQAEQAEREHKERRKIERAGISVEQVASWREALRGLEQEWRNETTETREDAREDERTERFDAAREAMEKMLDALTDGTRFDPYSLEQPEAAEQYRDLSERWGFGSSVDERIKRIHYLGLDADKSALEVLREMQDEERAATAPQLWLVAA